MSPEALGHQQIAGPEARQSKIDHLLQSRVPNQQSSPHIALLLAISWDSLAFAHALWSH